jgi:hypothetical protein
MRSFVPSVAGLAQPVPANLLDAVIKLVGATVGIIARSS